MTGWDQRAVERFFAKVQPADDPFACMLWTGVLGGNGYGNFRIAGRMSLAHRVAWQLMVGDIPEGLQLDHLCRVRRCVSWLHLEPVSAKENIRRSAAPSAVCVQTGFCQRGHSMADAYVTPKNGKRICRPCRDARMRTYRSPNPRLRAAA